LAVAKPAAEAMPTPNAAMVWSSKVRFIART